jgi:hypothetical protein
MRRGPRRISATPSSAENAARHALLVGTEGANLFVKIKDCRRIHTRYDRCAHIFMSAICIAATVIFWLNQ